MGLPTSKNAVSNAIRIYAFPVLVSILATLIWRDVTEMRSDVKMLLAQSNIDKTKIEQLEKDVRSLEQTVYNKRNIAATDITPIYDKYFKHEEFYDTTKYIAIAKN
jgi:hypothetical protein